ncbi:MAG: amidase [Chloroflexi bacterium]|nr:amidase [Chloroflexota bacterium]
MTAGPAASTSPIRTVAAAVAARRTTAVAMVEEALERIARLDPALNSVVALRAEQALREAEALDAALVAGTAGTRPGPLAGVPVLVKDLEDVAGMVTTQGSRLFEHAEPAAEDGLIPARLRAAGAIIVGKTNLPEFATEGFTDNLLFGATRNPWAPDWSPGGSSGGSSAAVAAGLVPIATATDGGGSIRIPAAFCGLVGLKPTHGVIGRWPPHDWIDFSTLGPFATSVADLRLLMEIEAGPVAGDPTARPGGWGDHAATAATLPPTRLFAAHRTSDLGPLPPGIQRQFEDAVRAMADLLGLPLTWMDPRDFFRDGDPDLDWFILAAAEHVAALGGERVEQGLALMHPAARAFMEMGLAVEIGEYMAARRRRFSHVRRMDQLLGESGLLLTPTVATEGWTPDGRLTPAHEPGMLPPDVYSTAVQNVTGHPAISLPAGRSANGVPFGFQVTGPRHADGLLLDVAERWEAAHPWPPAAPGYEPFGSRLSR